MPGPLEQASEAPLGKPSRHCRSSPDRILSFTGINPTTNPDFPHSIEATRDACGAARRNQIPCCVKNFEFYGIGELVPAVTELDGPREPVCLYPRSRGAKNEDLGHGAVSVALCVPPDTHAGSGNCWELACGCKG
jgi:hypothetical protein